MFRNETIGKVVVLGRKTMDTFPGGAAVSRQDQYRAEPRNPEYQVKDAIVVHSVEELLAELKNYDTKDVYVIGGDSVYSQLLPYCDTAHVTKIDRSTRRILTFPIWMPQ